MLPSRKEQAENMSNEYWAKTEKTILVPIKVKCHVSTGTVFGFTPPTLQECEAALSLTERIPKHAKTLWKSLRKKYLPTSNIIISIILLIMTNH